MVVENVRAVLCRALGRKLEKEDLAVCWATNLEEEVRSGALTMELRAAAARAKLRLAMALIAGGLESLGGRSDYLEDDCTATTSQWLQKKGMVVVEERQLLKPTAGSIWGSGEYLGMARGTVCAWIAGCRGHDSMPENAHLCGRLSSLKPKVVLNARAYRFEKVRGRADRKRP